MLDSDDNTTVDPGATPGRPDEATAAGETTAPAPRKRAPRKAAARTAPAASPTPSGDQTPAPSEPGAAASDSAAPVKAPRKRAARKTAAKTAADSSTPPEPTPAAAGSTDSTDSTDGTDSAGGTGDTDSTAATEPGATEPGATGQDTTASAPVKTPRKRTPRKSAAKAAPAAGAVTDPAATDPAATDPAGTDPAVGGGEPVHGAQDNAAAETPARTPRKRAARKSTRAASAPAPDAESAATSTDPAAPDTSDGATATADTATPVAGDAAPTAPAPPAALFMAPAEAEPARPRRRRAAKKSAPAATTDEPAAEDTETASTPAATGDADPDSAGTADAETTAPTEPGAETTDSDADTDTGTDSDTDTAQTDEEADPEDVREAAIEQASGARRRRRRGRRGRGGGGARAEEDTDSEDTADAEGSDGADTGTDDADSDDAEDSGATGGSRRRRRRRRSGSAEDADGSDDPPNTVTHVRDGGRKADDDGVRGVKGSTRLEAKRQRRRDGRETNRRRAPILTEAEFLARREAVDRVMAVRQQGDRTQIAVLEDDILVEHYVTRASTTSYVGNVYLGRVQNVLPSMEAAFVDIGKGRNGVLYAGEVNWDAAGLEGKSRAIENALKSGDSVLVQVTKDPIGHKGARLTSQISLPGRYLVLVPGGGMTGISRRLPDTERHRLKSILKKIVPDDAGVIVRTAAEGASEEDLTHDVERLTAQWEQIQQKATKQKSAPTLVHGEPDIAIRVVRDVFNEDFKKLTVQGDDAWATLKEYIDGVAPDLAERLSRHTKDTDLFHDLRVDEQLMKALDRKVWLPSGGSLVIDRTEAMTVVDVNTGKFVGSGGNLEQTVTRNNLEAAEEIVRQLRLRDVGGIVVIDFIDMVLESNRELVLRRLTECLGRDRTKHQVAEVTSLGLVQMTRKRVGEGLLEAFSETCEHCHGRGILVHTDPVDTPSGGADSDDDRGPSGSGKGRRRRGKGNGAQAPDPVELPSAANDEQRQAANAAIAAIHRAAGGEQPDSGIALVDELASGLFNAALAEKPGTSAAATEPGARSSAPVETDAGVSAATDEAADGAQPGGGSTGVDGTAATLGDGVPASAATDPAASAASDPAASAGAPTQDDPAPVSTPSGDPADGQPAPRRRRRVATRATSSPPAAEPAVVVVDTPPAVVAQVPDAEVPTGGTVGPDATADTPIADTRTADSTGDSGPANTTEDATVDTDGESVPASAASPAPRRRRRAASRPAGPPTS